MTGRADGSTRRVNGDTGAGPTGPAPLSIPTTAAVTAYDLTARGRCQLRASPRALALPAPFERGVPVVTTGLTLALPLRVSRRARDDVELRPRHRCLRRSARGLLLARRGEQQAGERLARNAVELLAESDFYGQIAGNRLLLARTLALCGKAGEAREFVAEALAISRRRATSRPPAGLASYSRRSPEPAAA